jgi:exonuclease 3'-5' domain-containing protein 1
MDAQSNKLDIVLVDSIPLLSDCLNSLIYFNKHYNIWPSLYIDLEGVDLGRHGSISILQLFAPSMKKIYIIDVYKLQDKAFSPVDNSGISLKFILETPCIQKGIFDLRNDSDALFSHYSISIHGIHDIQLMELASRQHPRAFLAGLARCVEKESPISPEEKKAWQTTKQKVHRLFDPALGGNYEIFNERPIKPDILTYCAQDVALLPGLYSVYCQKLAADASRQKFWEHEIRSATSDRIRLSQSPHYNGHTKENARGPWSEECISIRHCINGMQRPWLARLIEVKGGLTASISILDTFSPGTSIPRISDPSLSSGISTRCTIAGMRDLRLHWCMDVIVGELRSLFSGYSMHTRHRIERMDTWIGGLWRKIPIILCWFALWSIKPDSMLIRSTYWNITLFRAYELNRILSY